MMPFNAPTGKILRTYGINGYECILLKNPQSFGPIAYPYAMLVKRTDKDGWVMIITAEQNTMITDALALGGDTSNENIEKIKGLCVLGVHFGERHEILDMSEDWCDEYKFELKADRLIRSMLKPLGQTSGRNQPGESEGDSKSLGTSFSLFDKWEELEKRNKEQQRMARQRVGFFAPGYRLCDSILAVLLSVSAIIIYSSLVSHGQQLSLIHLVVSTSMIIALMGFARIRIAFALFAVFFFSWAGYSVARGFFMPPDWSDLVNPLYVGPWAASIAVEYLIGNYFWRKYKDQDFLDWLSSLFS